MDIPNETTERLELTPSFGMPALQSARVVEGDRGDHHVEVVLARAEDDAGAGGQRCSARLALATGSAPGVTLEWGDTVLVAGVPGDDLYVIGILECKASARSAERQIVAESGASAELTGQGGSQALKVRSPQGDVLFEYDSRTGASRVGLPKGDLEIVAEEGNIDFVAGKRVRFESRESIELSSPELELNAQRGKLHIEEAEYSGRRLSALVHTVKTASQRVESYAETAIEKAGNVYRKVEQLSQLDAGRVRTLVGGLYQLRSKHALLKAEEDVKIRGEKIHLG